MALPYDVWAVGGSRALSLGGQAVARYVAGELLWAGARLAVGCCTGADAAFIEGAAGRGFARRLWIFSAFGPIQARAGAVAAAGTCRHSAVNAVADATQAGAAIIPWAGGGPDLHIVARLRARTTQVAYAATAGGVIVADRELGAGSLLLASHLAAHGRAVYAVTLAPRVPPPGPGGWVAGQFFGLPCWRLPATAPVGLSLAA